MEYLLLIVGLVLLVIGAEALVRGASRIAAALGMAPLVIGLTIVAFGTSAPEFAVSLSSALAGQTDIAVGNVVGSNILNVLVILGLSAVIVPLTVARQLVWLDVPLGIVAALLVWLFSVDGVIAPWEGGILFAGLLAYTFYQIRKGRGDAAEEAEHLVEGSRSIPLNALLVVAGLAMLVLGSRLMVDSAVSIARALGVTELVIGLTVVALGTSLPELATSIVAAVRGQRDIAVGNVVGSNIFNLLGVLGLTAAVSGEGLGITATVARFDLPIMVAVAVACLPIFFTGHRIDRWEGGMFVAFYVAYVAWLASHASGETARAELIAGSMAFIVPLTLATIVIFAAREWHGKRRSA